MIDYFYHNQDHKLLRLAALTTLSAVQDKGNELEAYALRCERQELDPPISLAVPTPSQDHHARSIYEQRACSACHSYCDAFPRCPRGGFWQVG